MEWIKVKLKDIAKIKGGGTPSRARKDFYEGDIPWATVKDLRDIIYLEDTQEYITLEALKSSTANLIPAGNIILATRMGLGKVVINTIDVAINQDLKALFCSEAIYPKYLLFYLKSFSSSIKNQGVGITVKGITVKQVEDWLIPVPLISEQRRIVEILDQADELRKKRSQADRISDRILPALFIKMFGDPATNPMGWDMVKLESLGTLERGKSKHRPRNAPELYGGIYPFIQTGDIANCKWYIREYYQTYSDLGLKQSKMWKKGTLCITIAANIAKTGILSFDACFPDSVVGFRANNKTTTEFIKQWFDFIQKYLESLAPQSAQRNLNLETLRDLEIYLPPWDLQNQFTLALQRYQDIYSYIQKCDFKIDNLFQTLLHQAFSGELTAKWRESHMKELLQEMEHQAKALNLSDAEIEQLTLNL